MISLSATIALWPAIFACIISVNDYIYPHENPDLTQTICHQHKARPFHQWRLFAGAVAHGMNAWIDEAEYKWNLRCMRVREPHDFVLEQELLAKIANGDEGAFTSLFNTYQPMVYDFSLRLTRSRSTAEEIVQQIFIKVWINRAGLPAIGNFGAYINRSTRNECYSALRVIAAKVVREVALSEEGIVCDTDASHHILYKESSLILKQAVDNLPPQQKLVYQLCHEQGFKYEEAARQLNLSPGTVHKHMKLALKSIRARFKGMDAVLLTILLLNRWFER